MSSKEKNHYEAGAIHLDHHKEANVTINGNVGSDALAKMMSNFFNDAEEADFEEVNDEATTDKQQQPTENSSNHSKMENLVEQLAPIFFNDQQEAANFVKQIQNMKPRQITALVSDLVRDRIISDISSRRVLWTILHDNGLYPLSESNWNSQVKIF